MTISEYTSSQPNNGGDRISVVTEELVSIIEKGTTIAHRSLIPNYGGESFLINVNQYLVYIDTGTALFLAQTVDTKGSLAHHLQLSWQKLPLSVVNIFEAGGAAITLEVKQKNPHKPQPFITSKIVSAALAKLMSNVSVPTLLVDDWLVRNTGWQHENYTAFEKHLVEQRWLYPESTLRARQTKALFKTPAGGLAKTHGFADATILTVPEDGRIIAFFIKPELQT